MARVLTSIDKSIARQPRWLPAKLNNLSRRQTYDILTGNIEEILSTLVAFQSITSNETANHALFDYVAVYLKRRGLHVQRFDPTTGRREALVASTRRDNAKTPTVLLAAHTDVMAAEPEQFQLRREGNKYFGRGVYDMKNAIASYLKVVDDLRGHLAEYDFAIMLTSDEEVVKDDVNGVRDLVAEGYRPQVVCLPDGGRDWQLETSAKGIIRYNLEAHGKAAHGSRPWLGDNAVLKLTEALHHLQIHFKDHGPETDTFNVGVIEGGEEFNQVPHYAKAELEIRLNDADSKQRTQALITTLCREYDLTATIQLEYDPITTDINHPPVRSFSKTIENVVGIKMVGVKSYGGSDARYFAARGIPYMSFYPFGGGHHGPDEWLDVASLAYLPEILHRYLDEVAKN